MFVNIIKISQKLSNKSLLSIEKNIIEWEKTLNYIYNQSIKSFLFSGSGNYLLKYNVF